MLAQADGRQSEPRPRSKNRDAYHTALLGEEELSDVSLATFYVFDKENAGPPPLAQELKLAHGGGCGCGGCGHGGGCGCGHGGGCGGGGCRMMGGCAGMHVACAGMRVGCAGWHGGCAGWHGGCRDCRCGHFFFRRRFFGCGRGGCGGCGGCGGTCWIWTPTWGWVYTCWADSTPAGEVSSVALEQSTQAAESLKKVTGISSPHEANSVRRLRRAGNRATVNPCG
jgi:hypothetical protein